MQLHTKDVTISSGTTSAELEVGNATIVGLITPTGLSSTSLTFTASPVSGGTFATLKDRSGSDISVTVTSTGYQYALNPSDFAGVNYFKIVCGSSETSKTFKVVMRNIA